MKVIALSLLLSALVAAHDHKAPAASKDFNRVKALAGSWKGMTSGSKSPEKVSVVYTVTAGGRAVVEKLFPGTPHEMVSIYYDDKGKLAMTHYCMMGNRPTLALKSASADSLDLESDAELGDAEHMHALRLEFNGSDAIKQSWTSYAGGRPKETTTFVLTRRAAK